MLKVDEIINVINFKFPTKSRKKRMPDNFCYVCSQLDPRGSRGRNPYRYLFAKGGLRPCNHVPPAPHPTFVSQDDEGDDDFDDDSFEFDDSDDGAMFDTKIIRQDDENADPRLFRLPPVFGKNEDTPRQKRKGKRGSARLVPMVSENTFLTTNKRDGNDAEGGSLRLPELSNQRASLVAEEAGGGRRGQKVKDPRRLNSDRSGRRDLDPDVAKAMTRSGSSAAMVIGEDGEMQYLPETRSFLSSREKTDPPPQPIIVSIRNHEGEVVERMPLDELTPEVASDVYAMSKERQRSRKRREKKRRPHSPNGSVSPSFSGSISISRETTLSGFESPDFFFSRVRSASWCECPDHGSVEARCSECRRIAGHEKWCVSRNSLCQRCGKAIKRKYSQMERKSSFSMAVQDQAGRRQMPPSGMIITSSSFAQNSESPTRMKRHCSPTKSVQDFSNERPEREGSTVNRVRFQEGDKVVYPQWESFPDSGIEDDKDAAIIRLGNNLEGRERKDFPFPSPRSDRPFDNDVHRRAYDLALAASRAKRMFGGKKSKGVETPHGVYFSYFPLLKTKRPKAVEGEENQTQARVPPNFGVRPDPREGKPLKLKKGLKHILGDVKLEDYYPGGKLYPTPRSKQTKK